MQARVCLWLAMCACVRAGVSVGYFCQDPDTGHLHGLNTTWPATTFCGNYTCKIRARNQTMDHAESRTIINITRHAPNEKLKDSTPKTISIISQEEAAKASTVTDSPLSNSTEDRFLNHEEIKAISEMLHTVKKSDLEAIIEIYNLAQDIYKEMDTAEASNDIALPAEIESSKTADKDEIEIAKMGKTSYWYQPSAISEVDKIDDLRHEGSEFIPMSANTYKSKHTPPMHPSKYAPLPAPHAYAPPTNSPTYFSGTVLSNQDFGKLSYYYPVSNFQRAASYYHQQQRQSYAPPSRLLNTCDPCHNRNLYPGPPLQDVRRPYNPPPKPTEPAMLLPFPFSYQYYNGTGYAYNNYNNYYKGNPWAYYDYYKNNPHQSINIANERTPTNVNPNAITEVQNEEPKNEGDISVEPKDESKTWKSEPLTEEVIDEIRANIAERAKLLKMPLKKRIKLERLAKVIKLDNLNKHDRKTRHVEEHIDSTDYKEDMEVYIEKTTCDADPELGFFRMGDMSQPYPHCCPKKIEGPL